MSAMSTDSSTTCQTAWITTECTVDAVIARVPAATAILNAHNIDTCCGGRASLGEAAAHAHVDPLVLIGSLAAAPHDVVPVTSDISRPVTSCSCGCK